MATRTRSTGSATLSAAAQYHLINTRRSAMVYDVAGHQVGGGERLLVSGVDVVGQSAVDRGYLMLRPVPMAAPEPSDDQ